MHLPGPRAKNRTAHDSHLSDPVMAIIERLPRMAARSGDPKWLFTTDGNQPVGNFRVAKRRLDRAMGAVDYWQLRDLRRTATTLMARLGVPPHVADKVLNHTSGTIKGVAAVYNRFAYWEERVAAHDVLGGFVVTLVDPPDNVVPLRSA